MKDDVNFVINELSMHGQFQGPQAFCNAVERVMVIRKTIEKHGLKLYCHRSLLCAEVTSTARMQKAVQWLDRNKQRAWLNSLTKHGLYWEDHRIHSETDYLTVGEEIVTDSVVGEAAARKSSELQQLQLVSFTPSKWQQTPIAVLWSHDDGSRQTITVMNHWDLASVTQILETCPKPVHSWKDLRQRALGQYTCLTFNDYAFVPLKGCPFSESAARRIQALLNILNQLKDCFAEDGTRTAEGHEIYQKHFTGDKALFSDSSDTEKNRFENQLSFPHPKNPDQTLICTWHGKVNTPPLRIHFSWPMTKAEPIYVVYIGPKRTKR